MSCSVLRHLSCDLSPPLRNKGQLLTGGSCLSLLSGTRLISGPPMFSYHLVSPTQHHVRPFEVESGLGFAILLPQPL